MFRWLRRTVDLNLTTTRLATEADLTRVTYLFQEGYRRYYGLNGDELPALLSNACTMVIEYEAEIWGALVVSFRTDQMVWLRGLTFARGIEARDGMGLLFPPMHRSLRKRGVERVFYAGDEPTDEWLIPLLRQQGYVHETDVVIYEKRKMVAPSQGNRRAYVRSVLSSDLDAIYQIDQACFEAHWVKDEETIGSAMFQEGLFIVAELGSRKVGYAFATSHFGGRLVHLVRIAVNPLYRGQGIGVRLLYEVIDYARRRETQVVTLNTQAYNQRAKRLYRWFDFTETGERQPVLRYDL